MREPNFNLVVRVVTGILLALLLTTKGANAEDGPLGGPDSLVIYDNGFQPVQRLANLPLFSTCATSPSGAMVLGSTNQQSLLLVNSKGDIERKIPLYFPPQRVAAHPDGYLVVTHRGTVADVPLDGKIRREIGGNNVVNALPLQNQQGLVVVRTSGDLVLVSWDGKFVAHYDSKTAGHPVSVRDIALTREGQLVALDSGSNELIVLDTAALKELQRIPLSFSVKDISSLQVGSPMILALYPDKKLVRTIRLDGTSQLYRSQAPTTCATGLKDTSLALGITSSNAVYVPSGVHANLDTGQPQITFTSLFAILCYSLFAALAIVFLSRRFTRKAPKVATPVLASPSPLESKSLPHGYHGSFVLCLFAMLVAAGGLLLSWWSYPELRATGSLRSWGWYWLGALISATSFVYLGRKGSLYRGMVSPEQPTNRRAPGAVSYFLFSLSVISVAVVHYLMLTGGAPGWIVSTWIAGQVFVICAFTRPTPTERWSLAEKFSVATLLAITVITRVYKWTECPPNIHFDFGATAEEAVMILLKDWYPLFELRAGQTIGRAWLVQMAGSVWLFGVHEWAIRVPSLVWSVALTLSCYLLGRQTFSHRFGLIFGALVIAQHNLLAYSRLPYVTESTAPFIFCLYFLSRGIQTHAMRDWVLGGVWAGWSMMTVRTFTTFPLIGVGIFLFFCLFHLKVLLRNWVQILAMALGMVVVFSPHYYFYATGQHLSYRLSGVSPLISGFKVNPDLSVWWNQMSAAFGAILRFPDRPPWPSESSDPICMAITGSLFGAGLLFLIAKSKSIATPIAVFAMAGSIGFGSGFLTNPPSYYHHFVGITFVMFIVAVPLECLMQVVGALRIRFVAGALTLALSGLVGLAAYEQIRPFLGFCAWAFEGTGESMAPRSVYSLLSEHLLSRRNNRFVMLAYLQKGPEIHHSNCSIFYGQFSERHEINNPIRSYLPMRPSTEPKAVEFLSFDKERELDEVKKVYPGGIEETFYYDSGRGKMTTYTVSAAQVKTTYEESLSTGKFFDKEYYTLTPES